MKDIEGIEFFVHRGDPVTSFSQVTKKLLINVAALHTSKRVLEGGREGHEKIYGTSAEKQERWSEYQAFIDKAHSSYQTPSYAALTKMAADHFHVAQKTIRRHTRNPR